jgi:L-threonylcarbamoyladenylate synthase
LKILKLDEAIATLQKGGVVAIPTETVYGLAGWIFSEDGLKKIFSTKERPFFDPLIVHVDTIEKAKKLTSDWTNAHEVLAQAFWPGPLTLIAEKNTQVHSLITSGLTSVGLRCPRHPLTLELLAHLEGGLAAPSANKFGKTSPTRSEHVEAEFGDEVGILEGGPCEIGIESTVIGIKALTDGFLIEIFRPGFYTGETIATLLHQKGLKAEVRYAESPVAPGQLKHHYMPRIPLVIVPPSFDWKKDHALVSKGLHGDFTHPALWTLPLDVTLASRELYEALRSFDKKGHDLILVKKEPRHQDEAWKGIWNRLEKASSLRLE